MKKFNRVLASLGAMAMLAWGGVFTSCGSDDDSGPSFTSQVKVVSAEDLGAAASAVSSSDEKIAKAEVADGAVKITSVKEGNATVTATASGYKNAVIPVTVAKTGAITVGSVTKFEKEASGTLNSVSITGAERVQYNAADIKYTATADASENASVTYAWTVTADEGLVTAKSGEATGELTLTVNNTAAEEKTFTVKVTATCGSTSKEASKTVKVSANGEEVKNEVTGVSISASGQTESGVTIASDGSLVLTAVETKTGNPTLTYAWEVTDTENLLASKTGENTSALKITANNSTIFEKTVTVKVTVSDGTNSKDATITVSVKGKDGVKTIWDFSKSDASGTGASAWNGVPKPAAQGSALVTRAENSYTGYLGRKFWLVNGVYAEYRSNGLGYTNSANDATHESADFVKAIETEALTGPFVLNVTSGTANDARIFKIYMSTDKATLWDEANVKVSGKLEKKAYTVENREASQVYVGIGTLPSEADKKVYTSITKIELVADAEILMDKFKAKDFSVKFADEAVTFTDNAASLRKSPANNGAKILVETDPAYATGANVTFAYTATTGSDVSINANGKEASLVIADGINTTNTGVIKITVTDDSGTSLEKNITLTVTATVSDADKVAAAKADITTALTGENSTFDYMGTSVAVANATAVVNAATIRYKGDVTITYNTPSTAEPNLVVTVKLNEASDTVTYNFAEKYGVDNQLTAAVKALKALPAYTWASDADTTVTAINGAITEAVTKYDVTVTAVKTSSVKVTTTVTSAIDGGKTVSDLLTANPDVFDLNDWIEGEATSVTLPIGAEQLTKTLITGLKYFTVSSDLESNSSSGVPNFKTASKSQVTLKVKNVAAIGITHSCGSDAGSFSFKIGENAYTISTPANTTQTDLFNTGSMNEVVFTLAGTGNKNNYVTKITLYKAAQSIPATAVVFDASYGETPALTLSVGGASHTPKATLTPAYSSDTITYTTSDAGIVKVEDGKLVAVANGSATITATASSSTAEKPITATLAVTVSGSFSAATKAYTVADLNLSSITSVSSDKTDVVTAEKTESGVNLTAKGAGTATVTVTEGEGESAKKATIAVSVETNGSWTTDYPKVTKYTAAKTSRLTSADVASGTVTKNGIDFTFNGTSTGTDKYAMSADATELAADTLSYIKFGGKRQINASNDKNYIKFTVPAGKTVTIKAQMFTGNAKDTNKNGLSFSVITVADNDSKTNTTIATSTEKTVMTTNTIADTGKYYGVPVEGTVTFTVGESDTTYYLGYADNTCYFGYVDITF